MATVTLAPETSTPDGEVVTITTPASAADTFKFANDGKTVLLVQRAAGGTSTITVATPKTEEGLAVADKVVTIAAASTEIVGPFDRELYNDDDGNVSFTINAITGLTFAAIRVGN